MSIMGGGARKSFASFRHNGAARAWSLRLPPCTGKDRRVDALDMAILRELQEDGHLSLVELGQRVGLTAAPVQRRLRTLERDGWISRYVALVDPRRARRAFEVFLEVELGEQSRDALALFEEKIDQLPEITECHRISGRVNYLLKVVTRDVDSFNTFYLEHILSLPDVSRITTHISLSRVKYTTALPLARRPDDLE